MYFDAHETVSPPNPPVPAAIPSGTSRKVDRAAFNCGVQGQKIVLKSGEALRSVLALTKQEFEQFQNIYAPSRTLQLNRNSEFFRVTEEKWIKDGRLVGHPQGGAIIENHFAPLDNAHYDPSKHPLSSKFVPKIMHAAELQGTTVNVMFGEGVESSVKHYKTSSDRILVKMTLGDFLNAGGGIVFKDITDHYAGLALAGHKLIVTLPEGAAVPVTRVE